MHDRQLQIPGISMGFYDTCTSLSPTGLWTLANLTFILTSLHFLRWHTSGLGFARAIGHAAQMTLQLAGLTGLVAALGYSEKKKLFFHGCIAVEWMECPEAEEPSPPPVQEGIN